MTGHVPAAAMAAQTDGRLVELVGKGSERAFEAVVHRYRPALLRYCARIGLAEAPAEDVVQRSLTKAWLALARGTPVRELKPWLYRIVHNQAVSAIRRSRRQPVNLSDSATQSSLHLIGQAPADQRLAAQEALVQVAALPEMQREAIVLTAIEGRSHEEAADVLGVSDGAIRGLVHRARITLRGAAAFLFPPGLQAWLSRDSEAVPALERSASLQSGGRLLGMAAVLGKGVALAAASAGLLVGGSAELRERGRRTSNAHSPLAAQARERSRPAEVAPLPTRTAAVVNLIRSQPLVSRPRRHAVRLKAHHRAERRVAFAHRNSFARSEEPPAAGARPKARQEPLPRPGKSSTADPGKAWAALPRVARPSASWRVGQAATLRRIRDHEAAESRGVGHLGRSPRLGGTGLAPPGSS